MSGKDPTPMKASTAIIGGGVAGMAAALELADSGYSSVIVEASPYLGGQVAGYSCKALDTCQRCGACAMEDLKERVYSRSDVITFIPLAKVTQSSRQNGRFHLHALQRPSAVHPELCDDCGKCLGVCPRPNALTRSGPEQRITLDYNACDFYRDGNCDACVQACPSGAITLSQEYTQIEIKSLATIIATGFKPFDPTLKPRFGYGVVPGVLTAKELDYRLRNGSFSNLEGQGPKSIAFVQCVGSRDTRINRNYCSQVCCGYAVRTARLLKRKNPGCAITVFHMDIQTYDRNFDARFKEASNEIKLVRAMPSEIRSGRDGLPTITYHGPDSIRKQDSFDLVILSVGISPETEVAEIFGVSLGEDGFMETGPQGVYIAGTAKGPGAIVESIEHGAFIANQAIRGLDAQHGEG